jgi:hypothetical protein
MIALLVFTLSPRIAYLRGAALTPFLARPALNVIALVLLFGPGRRWFAPR